MQKVMIIVPVWNGAKFIERTLDSLVAQTYKNLSIVVLDNVSEDNTVELVRKYLGNKYPVKLIQNEINVGRVGNWNKALEVFKASDTDFCKLVFAGDTIAPDCIEKQIEQINSRKGLKIVNCAHSVRQTVNTSYDMVHFNIPRYLSGKEALEVSLQKGNWFAGTTAVMLFAKEVIGDSEFDESLLWASDWKFWAEIVGKVGIGYTCQVRASFFMEARGGHRKYGQDSNAQKEEEQVKEYIKTLLCE